MQIKKNLVKREIAGENILIPYGKTVYESNGMFVLTEVGAFIWDMLPEVETEEDILKAVLNEYEIDATVARADIKEFLDKLNKMGII